MSFRIHIKNDYFPSKTEITQRIIESKSKYIARYCQFIDLYYNYLFTTANTIGFDLLRMSFYECKVIIHRPNKDTWIFDFTNLIKEYGNLHQEPHIR